MAAFADLKTFDSLANPYSVAHQMLVNPFLQQFSLNHNRDNKNFCAKMKQHYLSTESQPSAKGGRLSRKGILDRSRNNSRLNSRSSHGNGSEKGEHLNISRVINEIEVPKPNPEETWISLDALILLGCLHCGGYDSQKAEVFHRIIAPEYESIVKITDKDLKSAMYFMITAATIVEGMIRDLVESPRLKVNFSHYEKLVAKYRPTF